MNYQFKKGALILDGEARAMVAQGMRLLANDIIEDAKKNGVAVTDVLVQVGHASSIANLVTDAPPPPTDKAKRPYVRRASAKKKG